MRAKIKMQDYLKGKIMSLKEQLVEEMKQAMKSGDKVRLEVIRYLRSIIQNYEIDHGEQEDEGVQRLVAQQVKQSKEAIAEFKKGERQDLVDAEEAKLAVLMEYLPAQQSDEELEQVVRKVIADTGADQPGPIIGQVMAKVKGQADGGRVAQLVNQILHEN